MARTASAAVAPDRSRPARPVERTQGAARPRLTVITRPNPRSSSVPFTILCTLIIVGTLFAVLMLNISMSDTSYRIKRLSIQSQQLSVTKQSLSERNQQLGTPQELERRATDLGMVPAADPAYIDLKTGKVIGEPHPAAGVAAPAQQPVPVARIYDDSDAYWGMGNEGH